MCLVGLFDVRWLLFWWDPSAPKGQERKYSWKTHLEKIETAIGAANPTRRILRFSWFLISSNISEKFLAGTK